MKGIAYLQEQGMLGKSADDVAEFFHTEDRLDKVSTSRSWDFVVVVVVGGVVLHLSHVGNLGHLTWVRPQEQ